jgi:hypothetical protein
MSISKVRKFPTCTNCSSDLAGRFLETKKAGDGRTVDIYKCGCGRERRVYRG